jgi:hypothetical protein
MKTRQLLRSALLAVVLALALACTATASAASPRPKISGLQVSPRKVSSSGHLLKGRCVKTTAKTGKPCRLTITLRVSFALNTSAKLTIKLARRTSGGKMKPVAVLKRNSVGAAGALLIKRKFAPGRYSLTLTARSGSRKSTPKRASFRITG